MQLFSIYTFGDVPMMWSVMNGIAAYFNNGAIRASMITFGGLFAIAFYSYKAAAHNTTPGEVMGILFGWVILLSAMAIPTSVVITDIYTGKVQKVDNVPLLISAPYSFISQGSWNVFQNFDTAFQPPSGSYLTVTQNGIVSPIELLISMRNSDAANNINPYLYVNLQGVVADCALGGTILRGPGTGPDTTLDTSTNPINYLAANMRQTGITNWYDASNTSGTVITCASAGAKLQSGFQSFVAGSEIQKVFTSSVKTSSPLTTPYKFSDYQNVHDTYISSISTFQQNAADSAITSLSASTIDYTMKCLGNAQNISSAQNCAYAGAAIASPLEQWKNESAQNASFFSRIMFSSMSIMQFLFLVLTPLVLIIIMLFPMHGIRIMMAYVLFGVWTNSWLIFAAPMNYYIQSQVVDALATTAGPWGGITIGNFQQVYSALSLKLALASDVMASTPLISLAILSGSMFSMNSLAGKWSGEKHSDPGLVSSKSAVNAPISQGSPIQSYNPNSRLGIGTGSAKQSYAFQVGTSRSDTTGNSWTKGTTSMDGKSFTASDGSNNKTTVSVGETEAWEKGQTNSEEQSLAASGFLLSGMEHKNSQMAAQTKKLAQENGVSEDTVRKALNLAVSNELSKKSPKFAADIKGDNGVDAQKNAQGLLDVEAGSYAKGAGVIGSVVSMIPQVGKLGSEGIGKYTPNFRHSAALAYGAKSGLSIQTTNAFEQASGKMHASTKGYGNTFGENQTFSLQTANTNSSGQTVTMDEHAAAMYLNSEVGWSARAAGAANYDKYAHASRSSPEGIAFAEVQATAQYSTKDVLTQKALSANAIETKLNSRSGGAAISGEGIQARVMDENMQADLSISGSGGATTGKPILTAGQLAKKNDIVGGVVSKVGGTLDGTLPHKD